MESHNTDQRIARPDKIRCSNISYVEHSVCSLKGSIGNTALLESELRQSQAIINLAHNKLHDNLPILYKHFNEQKINSEELARTLFAFKELNDLLNRFAIDEAFEALANEERLLSDEARSGTSTGEKIQVASPAEKAQVSQSLPGYELPEIDDDDRVSELLQKYRHQREIELKEIGHLSLQAEGTAETDDAEEAQSLNQESART